MATNISVWFSFDTHIARHLKLTGRVTFGSRLFLANYSQVLVAA